MLGEEFGIEPLEGLLRSVRLVFGGVEWSRGVVVDLESQLQKLREEGIDITTDDDKRAVHLRKNLMAYQQVYGEWLDRAAKHCKTALDAGVEQRALDIEQQKVEVVAGAITAVLSQLQLSDEDRARVPVLLREQIMLMTG